jgi:hypothetical protein
MQRRRPFGDRFATRRENFFAHVLDDLAAPRLAFQRFSHAVTCAADARWDSGDRETLRKQGLNMSLLACGRTRGQGLACGRYLLCRHKRKRELGVLRSAGSQR